MYPYYYYPTYPVTPIEGDGYNNMMEVDEEYFYRQPPALERRVTQLERQNERQSEELTRQNNEIGRLNQEIRRINQEIRRLNGEVTRLNDVNQQQTRRLQWLNQRLRNVENRFNIPFTANEDGF